MKHINIVSIRQQLQVLVEKTSPGHSIVTILMLHALIIFVPLHWPFQYLCILLVLRTPKMDSELYFCPTGDEQKERISSLELLAIFFII